MCIACGSLFSSEMFETFENKNEFHFNNNNNTNVLCVALLGWTRLVVDCLEASDEQRGRERKVEIDLFNEKAHTQRGEESISQTVKRAVVKDGG